MPEESTEEGPGLRVELERLLREQERDREYARYQAFKRAQQRRLYALTGVAVAISSAIFLYFIFPAHSELSPIIRVALYSLTVIIALIAAALAYLQPSAMSIDSSSFDENYARLRYYLDERLSRLTESNLTSGAAFTPNDKAQVLAGIQAKLESEALQEYANGLRELVTSKVKEESTEQLFQNIARRLGREVQDLARRGNLNLILGITTTLVGLAVLGYAVFYSPVSHTPEELLAYFVPRVSLVILIEVFAYFFLKLYKQSLAEIKYFQNEITNIESKQLAIQLATRTEDPALRARVVEELSKTERNFILGKDQTTVDLERERISRSTYADVASAIKDLIKRKSDG